MNKFMNPVVKPFILILSLAILSPAFSYSVAHASGGSESSTTQYDRKFRKNYKKYRSYSPEKKQRIQKLHKSVEGLSDEQKRKLRERVLNKSKPN